MVLTVIVRILEEIVYLLKRMCAVVIVCVYYRKGCVDRTKGAKKRVRLAKF